MLTRIHKTALNSSRTSNEVLELLNLESIIESLYTLDEFDVSGQDEDTLTRLWDLGSKLSVIGDMLKRNVDTNLKHREV